MEDGCFTFVVHIFGILVVLGLAADGGAVAKGKPGTRCFHCGSPADIGHPIFTGHPRDNSSHL